MTKQEFIHKSGILQAMTRVFNLGYHAGHHDTVENCYVDVLPCDMESYHGEDVMEMLSEHRIIKEIKMVGAARVELARSESK